MYHCMFEQSGTFKNAFKKLGGAAKDYDILNDYGETDKVIDLYDQIERAYLELPSLFDKVKPDDLIIAFYPCTRFEDQIQMFYRGTVHQLHDQSLKTKMSYDLYYHSQLSKHYETITKLVIVCLKKNLRLIIENPYSGAHYLKNFWALKPTVIDKDRTLNGDSFKKPTQFFMVNFEPMNNELEPLENMVVEKKVISFVKGKDRQRKRSEISPVYADRFIRRYIAKKDGTKWIV